MTQALASLAPALEGQRDAAPVRCVGRVVTGEGGVRLVGSGLPQGTRLSLAREFDLTVAGTRVALAHSGMRVLAYLGLADRPITRTALAGTLWLDSSERRASSNLRTVLWRIDQVGSGLLDRVNDQIALSSSVSVDVRELFTLARRLIAGPEETALADIQKLVDAGEVLPTWDDEWVAAERERYRLLRLEALEAGADALITRGQLGRALDAALAAVSADPLRETARRLVLRIRLAQGNVAEALRGYGEYRALLRQEVGLDPSGSIDDLVRPLMPRIDERVTPK